MDELVSVRNEITKIDAEMAELFEKRMKLVEKVADYKRMNGLSVKDKARENELIDRCRKYIKDPEIESYYVEFLKNNIELSCNYQSRLLEGLKISYCGVKGAFAHIASKKMFPDVEPEAFSDFVHAYNAVENGEYDCAVLPIENSYAGEVGKVMDLIFSGGLYINQVVEIPIVHNLLSTPDSLPEKITTVVSHPQALSQCADYIERHGFKTIAYSNTAAAAEFVKNSNDPTLAAIASEETAEIFGLKVLDAGINDSKNNTTRFASFSRSRNNPVKSSKDDNDSFILVFTVKNEAGALAQMLNILGAHGYNMKSLRSRPMKELQWSYFFYIEAEGNINNENGKDMLREMSAVCAKLKLVGAYSDRK